jgi:hypothetical protein
MGKALFFGNSHVAAYKLAHERLAQDLPYACAFFCALGVDPAFTEVRGQGLAPTTRLAMDLDEILFFCSDSLKTEVDHYLKNQAPLKDVGRQFQMTGGSEAIDLSDVTDIFYLTGSSPYDFRRLGEFIFPVTEALRNELLSRLLRDRCLLRTQLEAMRAVLPQIRHHFIGAPLRKWPLASLNPGLMRILEENRATISGLSGNYLFDDVFMPGPSVLAADLVSTRPEFFVRGNQQAQAYLGVPQTKEDILHVGADYAAIVFDEFVTPLMTRPARSA